MVSQKRTKSPNNNKSITLDDYILDNTDDDEFPCYEGSNVDTPPEKDAPVDSTASGSSTLYTTGGASYNKGSSTSAKATAVESTTSGSSTLYATGGASYSKGSSTSAKATEQTPEHQASRMMTIKTTVDAVCKPPYKKSLSELVRVTNTLVTHTYAFLKFIFLRELQEDQRFDMRLFLTEKFFIQVFYSLVQKFSQPQRHTAETSKRQSFDRKTFNNISFFVRLSAFDFAKFAANCLVRV